GKEVDPDVARLKSSVDLVQAIEPAVRFYEEPPARGTLVELDEAELWLSEEDWLEAFAAPEPGTPHNEAREQVHDALLEILADKADEGAREDVERALRGSTDLAEALDRVWPLVEATDLVGDLWTVPAYLRRCAPWLAPEEVRALQRSAPDAWTASDLPFLDAARARLGDVDASSRRRRLARAVRSEREYRDRVVEDMIAADVDREGVVWMLVNEHGTEDAVVDTASLEDEAREPLAGPFAHIVVDEAQELSDAQWLMLVRRCPSRSFTVVGDRAQARAGFRESWVERLDRVGLAGAAVRTLSVNYRSPQPVMAAAEPVIRAVLPDASVPTSVREGGAPVRHGCVQELERIVEEWLAAHDDGLACVVGDAPLAPSSRVRVLSPELVKGLEFDLVVLVDPDSWGTGTTAAVDRYVAMTRATQELVILG
ncbi:MAG: UvrD-helicase domain-containing protein, partial [Actinomycetota bacterium]|nr:UvrD-helicase domain-containing protein [Actinomycetota bacterium]